MPALQYFQPDLPVYVTMVTRVNVTASIIFHGRMPQLSPFLKRNRKQFSNLTKFEMYPSRVMI